MGDAPPLKVFVLLAHNKDAAAWRAAHARGTLVGINDETPYGYGRANDMGCRVTFANASEMSPLVRAARLICRGALGFDLVHAWRQRRAMAAADIVWTHTESQFLAAAFVLLATRAKTRLLGQAVWLIDEWPHLSWPKKWLYRRLAKRVDVMTFLSPANHARAQGLFPETDCRVVSFGVPAENMRPIPAPKHRRPFRVLAVGNDRHRDWPTLIAAVANEPDVELLICSSTAKRFLPRTIANVSIRPARSNEELFAAMADADIACVPLRKNLHASGITAIQEAVVRGLPVIASDTGGLQHYFSRQEVLYVPVGDVAAWRAAIRAAMAAPLQMQQFAHAAQARMGHHETHGAGAYIAQHVRISREVMRKPRVT
jgi:glycosyltransferase involved in cell wall biosynthesis